MNVTINTDASFCPYKKLGGFAFWITSDIGRIKAHTNDLEKSRNWVNDWCDVEAKKQMRKLRKIIN